MFSIILAYSFVLFMCMFLTFSFFNVTKCLIAASAWDDAEREFNDWYVRNQGVYIGLSDQGKKLLGILIEAYDRYLEIHKYAEDNGYRDYLLSLFNEMPPKSPNEIKTVGKKDKKRNLKGSSFIFVN